MFQKFYKKSDGYYFENKDFVLFFKTDNSVVVDMMLLPKFSKKMSHPEMEDFV